MNNKFLNALTIAVILLQSLLPIPALAMASTDQSDYAPGSVVTINGDNSDGAGFVAGEVVHVDVTGPNAYAAACESVSNESAFWFCQVTVPEGADAAGSYSYTATGQTSLASQSGTFTVTAPPPTEPPADPTEEPTQQPTVEPTQEPTLEPTQAPTEEPTSQPTAEPTSAPTEEPTSVPTSEPTLEPTQPAEVTPAPAPFIQSDKEDYFAGELVTLTSGNWQSGESVHLIVNDVLGDSWRLSDDVLADANGAFVYQFNLPNWFVAEYHIYAYGAVSGATTWDFTDSRTVGSATLNGGTSVTVAGGATISASVNVTTDNGGGNQNWRSTGWRISTTAPGTVTCVNHTDHDGSGSYSETFNITAPATAGTYNAYFVAYSNDTCTAGASNTLPLTNGVTVTGATTLSLAVPSPSSVVYASTGPVTFTATLTRNDTSGAVSGATISFLVDASSVGTAVTNGSGVATFSTYNPSTLTAGSHNVQATFAGQTISGVTFTLSNSNTQTLTITQATSTTTVTCPASVIYTGSALTPCTVSVTGAGGLSLAPTATYTNNVNVGTATASYTYAGDTNHTGSSDSKTFAIAKATSTTTVTCPASVTYTGSPLTPCTANVTGTGGLNQVLTVSYTNNTNAGTANASATYAGDANHNASSDSKNFTIDKAASVTTVTCPANVIYTGSPLTPCSANVTGAGGLNLVLTVNYTDNTNAGTATASASYAGDANHTASSDSKTFTIDKAASVTTVTCAAGPFTYNGTAQEPCSANVTGAGGLNQSLTVNYTDNLNAGTATASASYAGDTNHTGSSDSETFTIDQASSTTVVTCTAGPFTYDGSAQEPCSANVTGAGGLNQSLTVNYTDNVNAGTAAANASYAGDANHTGSSDSETFTIDQAISNTVVTCTAGPFTYNGSAQEPCSVGVTGAGGLNLTPNPMYADNVNAGTATASYTYPGDANHTGSSDSETFTIDKAASVTTVTCTAGPFIYNGLAQEPCTANVTGAGGLNLVLTVSYTDNVNAGTATASASYAGDANHTGSSDTETFTIDKAASTTVVTCDTGPFIYDGTAHEPCEVSVTGAGGLNLTPNPVYANNVDAGTATASYTYTGDANHTGSSDSETFTIDKADSVTTVTCPVSVIYNGSAQEPCSANVTGAGGLNLVLTVGYSDNTNAGTASASASYAGDGNHNASSDSETFEIEKAASITTVTCPVSVIYTGSAQEPCSANVTGAGGLNLVLTVNYTDNTNAGTASASASYAGDANHNGSNDSTTFEIEKADSVTTVTCPASVIFDGSAQEPCTADVTDAGGLNLVLTVNYTDNTDAGTATASASYAGDANHNGSSDSETFEIEKVDTVTTVTCPANVTYTGSAQEPCSANVTGAGGLNLVLTVSYTDNVNAGTATASASYAGDANHNGSTDSETFEIEKADSVTTVTCPASVIFDGSAQEPCTADVTGAGGLNLVLTVSYSDNTNAGTASASASYAGDANHNGSSDATTFEIEKAASVTTVTCPVSVIYNGLAQEPCTANVTGAGGLNLVLTVSYADNTNAGTATASASYTGDANHNDSSDSETFEIEKAASVTMVTCPASVVYTGSAQEPCSANVTGAGGLYLVLTVSYTDNVNAGTATASASYTGDANYNGSSDSKTFTIDKAASVTTVSCPASVVYNGSAQEPCTANVTGAGGLNLVLAVNYSDNTDAGTATTSASYAGDANHNGSSDSTTFEIEPADSVTTVTCPASVVYTGSAQEPCTANVTGAGGLNQVLTVSYTDNVNAGTATASASYAGDANHTASNDSETFEIEPADSVTTVTCPASVIYDGSAQIPCTANVTGAGGLNQVLTVSYVDNVNAGTATASASYAGDANHNGSSDTETFAIDKATSTTVVTCDAGPFVYDGTAQEPCSVSVTGAGGLSLTPNPVYANNVDAGNANASYTYAGDANHTGSSDNENFTIDQAASVTTVTCPANVTYTGSAQEPCSVSVTGAGGLNLTPDPTYTSNINAGTATASYIYAGDANHTGSSDSKNFTIDKADSVTTVTCPASVIYTGSAQEPCSANVTGAGGLNEVLTVSYTDNVNAGTATASASYAGDVNHNSSSDTETFAIDKAASVTTVTCPASVVYNGSAQEPCSANVTGDGGLNQVLIVSYTDNVNAGTATASASYASDANHNASGDTKTFTIDKAASVTTVTCPANVTYTGAAQTPCSASVTGAGGLNQVLIVSYTDNVNAGTATASASYAGDANHNGSSDTETFAIDKAASVTTVTCPANVTYTGSALTPCSASVTGVGGLNQSLTVNYTNNVNAGTATASASFAGDANHTGSSDSKTFTIDKAVSITTVTCPASVNYTGSAQTPCSATATGAGGLNQSLTVNYTNNVNAGTATASASFAGDANHTGSSDSKNFTINKASSTTTVTCAAEPFIYNGAAQTPCTANVSGAGGLNQSLTVSYTNNVNAGTATASATYAGDANHTASSDSKNFTITKAPSTVIVTCPASVNFTGLPQTPCTAVVTGVGGLNQALTVSYTNNINVGTATASASYAGDANHNGSNGSATFTIAAWTLTGFYQPVDMYGVLNLIKGGQTVPLKFEIFAGATELTNTSAVKSLTYVEVSCSTFSAGLIDEIDTTATGGTSLRYDSTSGQFIYNWKTPSTAGKCYRVTMTTNDNSTLVAYFKTK